MMKLIASAHLKLMELRDREDGQAYTEYGILLVIVAIGLLVTLGVFRDQLVTEFNKVKNAIVL